jgi:hypothetical protein
MKYKTIYADPPWPEYGGGKIKRGADRQYPLMRVRDIIALGDKLHPFIDPHGCHLYLWATNNFLPEALEVMKAWGFEYKTTITWMKDRFGIGQYFRGQSANTAYSALAVPFPTTSAATGNAAKAKPPSLLPALYIRASRRKCAR